MIASQAQESSGSDPLYIQHLQAFRAAAIERMADCKALFTTDATDLFQKFLAALPEHLRQHYTCHSCRHFFERFGNLVTIDEDGRTSPVFWSWEGGHECAPGYATVRRIVSKAKVTGVFLSPTQIIGTPANKGKDGRTWCHLHCQVDWRFTRLSSPDQKMAEVREEYAMLQRGLAEFSPDVVAQALSLLESEALYRNEKVIGPARWLNDLHVARARVQGATAHSNVTWLAAATAPRGFCHVRTTMLGTLLEDIANGGDFEGIKRRFAEKMAPTQYQRPTAAPTLGALARAEKVVAELGAAGALRRRYARLEEIPTLWKPTIEAPKESTTVFGHLAPKAPGVDPIVAKAPPMTWAKFARDVLPGAERMRFWVPAHGLFIAICTAADPDAPPILQWDTPEKRNPFNWYVYGKGSPCTQWRVTGEQFCDVTAITRLPARWNDGHEHHGDGAIFILDGCRDVGSGPLAPYGRSRAGLALFPEVMKAEYREIRSSIEAYSNAGTMEGAEQATACGYDLRSGGKWSARVKVTARGGASVTEYTIDRWE